LSTKNPPIAKTQYQTMARFQWNLANLLDFFLKYRMPLTVAVTDALS